MGRVPPWCLNAVCIMWASLVSIVYELFFLVFLAAFLIRRRGRVDEALRLHNAYYGTYMVRMFWPLIRVRRSGREHVPVDGPAMVVTNHRSPFDIFFFGLVGKPNMTVLIRSWPFRMPVLGWFMRRAGYIDVECQPFERVAALVGELAAREVSFLCFPEGHRSRDGRLQRFRSGAFRLAVERNLPVLPVCIAGTERILRLGRCRHLGPARIDIDILPPVDPAFFTGLRPALRLRRHVERIFKEHLGE